MNMRKQKVVFPNKFGALVQLVRTVLVNSLPGLLPTKADGSDGAHPFLTNLHAQNATLADDAVAENDKATLARENSQVKVGERDALARIITEQLRLLRDFLFSHYSDDFRKVGSLGFEVIQTKVRGASKPDVIIAGNFGSLIELSRLVYSQCLEQFPAGTQSFIDDNIYGGSAPAGDDPDGVGQATGAAGGGMSYADLKENADNAELLAREARVLREQSQVHIGNRNRMRTEMYAFLRSARDYAFTVTADDYSRVGQLGFEVVETSAIQVINDNEIETALAAAYRNILHSDCNENGVVNTACICGEFGVLSDECVLVTETDNTSTGTVQILDVAVNAGLLDP